MQRRALVVVRRLLRPWKEGLLPPADKLPFLVEGSALDGAITAVNLPRSVLRFTQYMIDEVFSSERLLLVHRQEQLTVAPTEAFSVSEFLTGLAADFNPEELAVPEEQELQTQFAKAFVKLSTQSDLPEYLALQVKEQIGLLQDRVEGLLQKSKNLSMLSLEDEGWKFCASVGSPCACQGFVRFGSSLAWSSQKKSQGSMNCTSSSFHMGNASNASVHCECLPSARSSMHTLHKLHIHHLFQILSAVQIEAGLPSAMTRDDRV
jgi:hypothetical protein